MGVGHFDSLLYSCKNICKNFLCVNMHIGITGIKDLREKNWELLFVCRNRDEFRFILQIAFDEVLKDYNPEVFVIMFTKFCEVILQSELSLLHSDVLTVKSVPAVCMEFGFLGTVVYQDKIISLGTGVKLTCRFRLVIPSGNSMIGVFSKTCMSLYDLSRRLLG